MGAVLYEPFTALPRIGEYKSLTDANKLNLRATEASDVCDRRES